MPVVREKVPGVPGFYRIKRQAGYVYQFRYPGQTGWTNIPGYPGEQEAKRTRNKMLGLEEHERTVTTQVKFFDFAAKWIETSPTLKPRTRRLYETQLRLHLAHLHRLRLHEIDSDVIRQRVIAPMVEKGLSGNTVRVTLVALGSVMTAALDEKRILVNPVSQIGKRARPKIRAKRKRILSPEEAANFLRLSLDDQYRAIFAVMLFAGLRISETLGLTWGDLDLKGRKIRVWRQLAYSLEDATIGEYWTSLKGDEEDVKDRDVEVSNVLREILIAHRGDRVTHRDDLIFVTSNATPYTQRNIQRAFKSAVERAALNNEPELTPHQCRHNFASALIASGADVGFVADQLGHADPNVTLGIYRHEFKAAREAGSAAAAIDRIYGAAMLGA